MNLDLILAVGLGAAIFLAGVVATLLVLFATSEPCEEPRERRKGFDIKTGFGGKR